LNLKIDKNFDPVWETMGLLRGLFHQDELSKEKYDSTFMEFGIKNNKVIDESYNLAMRYISAFSKKASVTDEDSFFFKGDVTSTSLDLILGLIIEQNLDWLTDIDAVSETDISSVLASILFERVPQSLPEIIELLQEMDMTPEQNWNMMLVFKDPKFYMKRYTELIIKNEAAYLFAMNEVKDAVEPLLEQFLTGNEALFESEIEKVSTFIDAQAVEVIPSVVSLSGILFSAKSAYVGLYYPQIHRLIHRLDEPQADLTPVLKALGDSSKFEILKFLRRGPSYNLEIAKHLGITPATTSHHMNVLFGLELVSMKKANKKAYYTLNEPQLKKVAENLAKTFEL